MMTLEKIFCSTDLRPSTDEALSYALALAKAYEAKVYVCHAVEQSELREETKARLGAQIAETVQRHCYYTKAGRPGLPNWEPIIAPGDAAETIIREAAQHHADLIVMHSRRQSYAATLLGSTAEAVSRTAPCPVLITHPHEREWVDPATGEIQLTNILMAYDFSNDSEVALMFALLLAEEYQSKLHLMHVLPPKISPNSLTEFESDEIAETTRQLQEAIPEEAKLWCQLKPVVRLGKPYREILGYADEHDIDLICMGVRGAGFGMQSLFGSNVDRVLRQSSCPVLIARPLKPASFVLAETKIEAETRSLPEG
jgi:nucleotide-binding universal stress UspA family protein